MTRPFLACEDLNLSWGDRRVLSDVSFRIDQGTRLVIAGETGSGKSSLLKTIAGLLQPDSGSVWLQESRVEGANEKLVPGHPAIAYLSQHFELPKFLRVEQILGYANTLTDESATELYRLCQVDHLLQRRTDELSGGEKQRIALARLLITSPNLLLLDEPFSHLDMGHKATLKQVVADVSAVLDITCVMVSHHPDDTLPWADYILVLREGRIVQEGNPQEIYSRPHDEYVAGLFGIYSVITDRGETLLLRPEQVRIMPAEAGATGGHIRRILFFGSYSLAEVENDAGEIVRAFIQAGDIVGEDERVGLTWKGEDAVRLGGQKK